MWYSIAQESLEVLSGKRRAVSIALISLVLAVAISGCSSDTILGVIPITDSTSDPAKVHEVVLGADTFDSANLASVALTNSGSTEVAVSRIVYSSPEAFSIYSDQVPGAIPPGERAMVEISFHPAAPGTYRSTIEIYLEGREQPVTVEVTGTK